MEQNPGQPKWYESMGTFMQRYRFNWVGRTREGVSKWIGAPKGPSERVCNFMVGYGIVMCLIGLITGAALLLHVEGSPRIAFLTLIGGIHGPLFSILGLWLRKMSRNLARLKTVEELAQELGATPETVKQMAEEHSIRARININDRNLYDPDEFVASKSLLRGAARPIATDTLLRPTEPSSTSARSETLLRPVEPNSDGLTPIQQLFAESDRENGESDVEVQRLRH